MSLDTTPLLAGRQSTPDNPSRRTRTSIPNANTPSNGPSGNSPTPAGRHWSEETEDIPGAGADPNLYGHQNTGAGYRRRGRNPIAPPYSSDLDAERFSGQDRPTGIRRVLYGCCCFPCRRAVSAFQTKFSKTEKYAIGWASLFFVLAVGFMYAYVRAREQLPASGKNGICTSRECTIVAADILRDMKPQVDPCSDFFSYTCGGWVDRVPIPDDKSNIGYFTVLQTQNKARSYICLSLTHITGEVIRSILSPDTESFNGKDDATKRNLAKLQALYGSCMDEKKLSEVGVKPLTDLVQKLLNIFPAPLSILDSVNLASVDALQQMNAWLSSQQEAIQKQPLLGVQRLQKQEDEAIDTPVNIKEQIPLDVDEPVPRHLPGHIDSFLRKDLVKRLFAFNSLKDQDGPVFISAEREQLAQAIAQLSWVDVTGLVEFDVDSDPKSPDENVFKLGESGLGLSSKEYYSEEKIMAIYQTTIEDMFTLIMGKDNTTEFNKGPGKLPPVWAEVAKNIIEFEKLLAAISNNPEDLDNSELNYNPRTLAQITELIPAIDWPLLLEKLLAAGAKVPDPIIVSSPEYLQKLNALLKETPATTLQNYFAWKLISRLAVNLGAEFRKPMQRLKAALQGVSADLVTPRWDTCVDVIDQALGAMAGHFFIGQAFKGDSKEGADSIITSLRTAFVKGLGRLAWLDHETLANATEKVAYLVQKVGYSTESPNVRSSDSLEEYFKDLGIDKADFFGNQMRARTWNVQFTLNQLGKPVDKARWLMTPQTVNAYYEIVFPAGILQQPFFHGDNPEYLNFGGVGVVAGHELTHAFDNEGRQYDAHGRLSDWWSNSTLKEFNKKSQCFIDQYGNFTVKDPQGRENHVNGKLTLGENLADNGGLKTAYDAWQVRFKADPHGNRYKNHLLSGLEEFNRDQLFYMAFARVWCSQRRPASAIESLRTDPHAPAKWRVNGAVQNSKHFAEVFNCAARKPMNPDTKCEMW
ncbi:hypothetical protein BGZ82_009122 [Podila clonocystis]|nr:hypothetical protein BGZ82_009122 [Podila clonocystis]